MRRGLAHDGASRPIDRGQTGIDFLVGIGIFLLTIAFVFGFIPGILVPFAGDSSTPLLADRVADTLVNDFFVDRAGAVSLNETCTVAFFAPAVSDGSGCSFDASEPDLPTRVGIPAEYQLNVTLERNVPGQASRERLCGTPTGVTTCGPSATPLTIGASPPAESGSVVTATRIVLIDEGAAVLVVRLW